MEESTLWRDWVLVALADLPSSRAESERAVIEEVAIRFADRFGQDDRVFDADCPRWHGEIRQALAALRSERLVTGQDAQDVAELTEAGRRHADTVRERSGLGPPRRTPPARTLHRRLEINSHFSPRG